MKKYKAISLHLFKNECTKNCSFCYAKKKKLNGTKTIKEWISLIPSLNKYTDQIPIGAIGEPLLNHKEIYQFTKEASKQGLICNLTTNGDLVRKVPKRTFKYIRMVSISFDREKVKDIKDFKNYIKNVRYLRSLKKEVGVNLLVDNEILKKLPIYVNLLFKKGVNRIFALCQKPLNGTKILKYKSMYQMISMNQSMFFVDDATKCIIESNSYKRFKTPCHYANFMSINPDWSITGCSFEEKEKFQLNKPADLDKAVRFLNKLPKKHSCPFIK